MTLRRVGGLLGVVAVGSVAGLVYAAPWRPHGPPVAEFAAAVDLGDRRPHEVATADFPISNRGDQPLVVEDIRTSCSCAGLEVVQDGQQYRVGRLVVPPGQQSATSFRVSVGVPPGHQQQVSLQFRTNDPRHPAVHVLVTIPRVVGAPSASPSALSFGAMALGARVSERLALSPNGLNGLHVVRAESSRPDLFAVEIVRSSAVGSEFLAEQVVVTPVTAAPADLAGGSVLVQLADSDGGRHDLRVEVAGRVRRSVEPVPSRVLMPRQVSQATAYLVSQSGQSFRATILDTTPGLTAAVEPEPALDGCFQVKLVIRREPLRVTGPARVRLTMSPSEGAAYVLEVPVTCAAE